ncbi:hypothetical protein DB346_08265 [Verrucomicrobia bacterium LW23]|nr:hypothetical protein DB346_08265 [Verrucomicrobia bacterium LW23]
MKLTKKNGNTFTPHPEYTGPAVCVDVTPLKKITTKYGEREIFRLVFETTALRADGSPFLVWSSGFTPSLHEKASFRKFLRAWMGRDLLSAEQEEFDTDSLLGKTAQLVIVHADQDGSLFANIAACTPLRTGSIQPSGRYVRVKDRQDKDSQFNRAVQPSGGSTSEESADGKDWKTVKVHVGRHSGIELRDLEKSAVESLIERWLPEAKAKAKTTADDRRLMAALEAAQEEFDSIPY